MSEAPSQPPGVQSTDSWPYVFPEKALRRWARENLTLAPRSDGGVDATFRFEGSTCGNIDFALRYFVTASDEADGRRIGALHCAPAPFDDGHTRMCSYQEDAASILEIMRTEAPLQGQPLKSVLSWRPARSPAGCLCAEPSRNHKWQAVLETLHFALTRQSSQSFQ